MVFKYIIGAVGMCMSLLSFSAFAIPSYDYNTTGDITGVTGLVVDGADWDMTLHDGSFDELFATYGTSAIYTSTFSFDATTALHGYTSTQTEPAGTLLGCFALSPGCNIVTAHTFGGIIVAGYADRVVNNAPDLITPSAASSDFNGANFTFATWELAASSVPEPSIVLLIASGLVVLGVARRKVRA